MAEFRPRKKWGQHFLTDRTVLRSIVDSAGLNPGSVVVEVGAGTGSLTELLAREAGEVIAVEIDKKLVGILRKRLKNFPHVKIVAADILALSLKRLLEQGGRHGEIAKGEVTVIGNLPYYITTPIIAHLLEERALVDTILITVQKEVALRLVAGPGTRDYGAISVFVRFYTEPKIVRNISRGKFSPRPRVDSALVHLKVLPRPRIEIGDEKLFFRIVQAGFAQRRKMIVNALAGWSDSGLDKKAWTEILARAGIGPRLRAENLSLEDFARIESELSVLTTKINFG